MKNKYYLLICILIISALSISCVSNYDVKSYSTLSVFSTTTNMQIISPKENNINADSVWNQIKDELQIIENNISVYNKNSDIYTFNNLTYGKLEVSRDTYDAMILAKSLYELTNGLFDPSIFPLLDLWGFTDRHRKNTFEPTKAYDRQNFKNILPDQKYIQAFVNLVAFDQIGLEEVDGKYYLIKPDISVEVDGVKYYMQIDLGGIGKGIAVEKAKEILKANNIDRGYFSCGVSSIYCMKRDVENLYKISFNNPRGSGHYMFVEKNDITISTSGDYENYYEIDNIRYCHIIDPKKGKPINENIIAASVVCDNAIYGDALSTALCVGGIEFAKTLSKEYEISVTYIDENNNKKIYTNSSIYKITNKEYSFGL